MFGKKKLDPVPSTKKQKKPTREAWDADFILYNLVASGQTKSFSTRYEMLSGQMNNYQKLSVLLLMRDAKKAEKIRAAEARSSGSSREIT